LAPKSAIHFLLVFAFALQSCVGREEKLKELEAERNKVLYSLQEIDGYDAIASRFSAHREHRQVGKVEVSSTSLHISEKRGELSNSVGMANLGNKPEVGIPQLCLASAQARLESLNIEVVRDPAIKNFFELPEVVAKCDKAWHIQREILVQEARHTR